jgi:hypothetical protein
MEEGAEEMTLYTVWNGYIGQETHGVELDGKIYDEAYLRAALELAQGNTLRHVKNGLRYVTVGLASVQVSTTPTGLYGPNRRPIRLITDNDKLMVYRGEKEGLYIRHSEEMVDGRFEVLS